MIYENGEWISGEVRCDDEGGHTTWGYMDDGGEST